MKSIFTPLLLPAAFAGALFLSGCSSWHTTGETVVGDPTIPHNSANLKSQPIRGSSMSAPAVPPTGNAAHGSGSVSR
jgi:hypothetical protein